MSWCLNPIIFSVNIQIASVFNIASCGFWWTQEISLAHLLCEGLVIIVIEIGIPLGNIKFALGFSSGPMGQKDSKGCGVLPNTLQPKLPVLIWNALDPELHAVLGVSKTSPKWARLRPLAMQQPYCWVNILLIHHQIVINSHFRMSYSFPIYCFKMTTLLGQIPFSTII